MTERSFVGNESNAVPPPARMIFFRRSLIESSLTVAMKSHDAVSFGSVVRTTDAMASLSASSALATCGTTANASNSSAVRRSQRRAFTSLCPFLPWPRSWHIC